jgi:hypothetical protein
VRWFLFLIGLIVPNVNYVMTADAQTSVELELVLAVDASTSIDFDEYELQRQGLSQAFRHPSVLAAIEGLGQEGLAVSVVQWSGADQQVTSVDWALVNSRASALVFADRIAVMPRRLRGFTDIAGAISYSASALESNGYTGRRMAIDVSGDGTSDRQNPATARDAAVLKGITINGLIIHSIEYDLGELARIDLIAHYRDHVIGGPGAFMLEAENFTSFGVSMREKLRREISGPQLADRR